MLDQTNGDVGQVIMQNQDPNQEQAPPTPMDDAQSA